MSQPASFSPPAKTGLLSVCMIVKNEGLILERCLKSIQPVADELVIVDTGSSDNTVDIARKFSARIIQSEWRDDFSFSRNLSIRNATCPWILWLDADDVVPETSLALINQLKNESPDKVFGFIVRNQKPGNTGSEFVQARMFPNHPSLFFERRIHEQIMLSALRQGLKLMYEAVVIEHHGYADPKAMHQKAQRNIRMLLDEFKSRQPDPTLMVEIADSYTITEDDEHAGLWYQNALNLAQCVEKFPSIASQALMGLGNIENRRNRYPEAIAYFSKALKLTPDRPDALYSLGVSFDLAGRNDEAVAALKRILEVKELPLLVSVDFRLSRIKAFLRLERMYRELGKDAELLGLEPVINSLVPSRPEILNALGSVYFRLGKLMDALHRFEKSLELTMPGNIDAFIGLCMIYQKAGKKELIDKTVGTMVQLFRDNPRFWAACSLFKPSHYSVDEKPDSISAEMINEELALIRGIYSF
jgi:glycosyltransferase involved in cell wall biosynthesis